VAVSVKEFINPLKTTGDNTIPIFEREWKKIINMIFTLSLVEAYSHSCFSKYKKAIYTS
jgi:hypothetical protein